MRWRISTALILVLGLTGAAAWWWWLPRGPNVLLITLDTTRADRLRPYGYSQAKTPFLDRLASQGIRFNNAISPIPLTLPSHATMLTGLLPPEHGLRTNAMGSLPAEIPTLAEHFSGHGYRTGAFLGAFVLDKRFGLDRGFAKYDDDLSGDDPVDERNLARRRKADRVIDSALSWLLPRRRQPYFCWIHLYDPHSPRSEHSETFGKEFSGREYDAELAFVDQQLDRLTSRLRDQGLMENTIVIIVGDHGESLGEHGEPEHGHQLYQATLRVPLIVHSPERYSTREPVMTTVGLNDLLPTLVDCLGWDGVEVPTKVAGRSLRPALEGQRLDDVPYYCETWEPFFSMHCMPQFGIVSDGWKYIRSPKPELYQLSQDPEEKTNLATVNSQRAATLDVLLKDLESRFVIRTPGETRKDAQLDQQLRSLGYSGGNSRLPETGISGRLQDVKDLMPGYRLAHAAMAESIRDPRASIAILERVAGQWPQLHHVRTILASLLVSQANLDGVEQTQRKQLLGQAETICRDVIDAEKDWPETERIAEARSTLATILAAADRFDEADNEYEQATKMQPSNATLFLDWGRLLLRRNQTDKALERFQLAVQIDEGLFTAQLQVGEILMERARKLSNSGRSEDQAEEQRLQTEALDHFEKAVRYNPQFLPAHYFAAAILMSRKQYAAAAAHYQQIASIDQKGSNVRYLWAVALANQNQTKQAAKLLHEVLAINPTDEKARNLLAICEDGSQ